MAIKGFTRNIRPLEMLTDEQVEAIHRGTLEVLERTGVRFESKKGLKVFESNGCQVDYNEMRVRIPPGLVEDSLRKCPSSFLVKARDSENDLQLGGNTTYFTTMPGMETVDLNTWEPRPATKSENDDAVKILDALDNHHLLDVYTPYFNLDGVPPVMSIPESVASKIRNSAKFQITGYQKDCEIFTIKMAQAIGIEIMGMSLPSAPLTYYEDAIESIFRFVQAGFPILVGTGIIIGGTAPVTIAGATISGDAEIIPGIVLAQLIRPGARVLVDGSARVMNMRSGSPAHGDIGHSLHDVVFSQMWRKYEVPTFGVAVESSSKEIDFQCGYEKAMAGLLGALSGLNVIVFHGGIHGELTFHPVQAILDDDVAGRIGRFIEGFQVTEETLATELIMEVGPIPGSYLDKKHTREWWKKELFVPKVADRLTYPEWLKSGKKNALAYARERMEEIINKHKPKPLTEEQDKEINKILEKARQYYKQRGMI